MIKHLVMFKLKENAEGATKIENALKLVSKLEDLKEHIPEIVQMEAGCNCNPSDAAYDVALYSSFVNREELEKYRIHPEHVKVAAFIGNVAEDRAVVDYEV